MTEFNVKLTVDKTNINKYWDTQCLKWANINKTNKTNVEKISIYININIIILSFMLKQAIVLSII